MFKGEVLLAKLEEKNLTQSQLARRVGLSKMMIHYLIHGLKDTNTTTALRIASVLECTVDELVKL